MTQPITPEARAFARKCSLAINETQDGEEHVVSRGRRVIARRKVTDGSKPSWDEVKGWALREVQTYLDVPPALKPEGW